MEKDVKKTQKKNVKKDMKGKQQNKNIVKKGLFKFIKFPSLF